MSELEGVRGSGGYGSGWVKGCSCCCVVVVGDDTRVGDLGRFSAQEVVKASCKAPKAAALRIEMEAAGSTS